MSTDTLTDIPKPSKLRLIPIDFSEACLFIKKHHRHHLPPVGHKFSLAAVDETDEIRGVATIGRPVNRTMDDGMTLEVNRVATDGCKNCCSFLYAAAWRATRALGYGRLITYILDTEPGTSLVAAGWKCVAQVKGHSWSSLARPRIDKCPLQGKLRFEVCL